MFKNRKCEIGDPPEKASRVAVDPLVPRPSLGTLALDRPNRMTRAG